MVDWFSFVPGEQTFCDSILNEMEILHFQKGVKTSFVCFGSPWLMISFAQVCSVWMYHRFGGKKKRQLEN